LSASSSWRPSLLAIGTGWLSFWMIAAMMVVSGLVRGLYNASRDVLVRRAALPGAGSAPRSVL